ncbi:MAG: radical SAM protein, partial [Candidatus Anammoxibacter sp.]
MYKKASHFYKILKKSPFGDLRMARWVTRLFSFQLDSRLKSGFSFAPYLIHMMPTEVCNLRCKSCGQWGSTGFFKDTTRQDVTKSLDKDVFKTFIDQVAKFKPTIFLTGGEPFLYKNIVELIYHIKSRNLICCI